MGGRDREAVLAATRKAEPEVIVHQMTSLGTTKDSRRFDEDFAVTNELRTRGTDYLLQAARLAGEFLVAQMTVARDCPTRRPSGSWVGHRSTRPGGTGSRNGRSRRSEG